MGLMLRVASNFLFNPPFNTNPKPHLQKVLSYLGLRTWDPM